MAVTQSALVEPYGCQGSHFRPTSCAAGFGGERSATVSDVENVALRALLVEAGLSNCALARAVVVTGAKEGVHLGTSTTSVKRMLEGAQPRWPVPRIVAKVLAARLGHAVSVEDCGFAD